MGKMRYIGAQIIKRKIDPPSSAKIFCFTNQKGGVAKSTSAQIMCEALAMVGYKVLAVDLDVQTNFSNCADATLPEDSITMRQIFDYMMQGNKLTVDLVHRMIGTTNGGYDIMQCEVDMLKVDADYGNNPDAIFLLKNILELVKSEYHYIVIDTQPNLLLMTQCAYCAADELLIPMEPNASSTDGVGLLLYMYQNIKVKFNPNLAIGGAFFTLVEDGANARDTIVSTHEISEEINVRIFSTYIVRSKIYDNIRDQHISFKSKLLKNPKVGQYLVLINEIMGTVLFKLMMEET